MARLLVAHGADVNSSDDYPLHPLHDAIERYYPELVEFLLRHGARVEETRDNNWSPLWHAVGSGSFADYAFGGVHQYERTYGGQEGAEISREEAERRANRNRRTIALLLDAGADPMAPSLVRKMQDSVYSRIPFQRVCYWGEAALVRHVLRKGAKPNVRGRALLQLRLHGAPLCGAARLGEERRGRADSAEGGRGPKDQGLAGAHSAGRSPTKGEYDGRPCARRQAGVSEVLARDPKADPASL